MSRHALPIRERLLLTMQMTCVKVALAKEERTKAFASRSALQHINRNTNKNPQAIQKRRRTDQIGAARRGREHSAGTVIRLRGANLSST